MAQSNVGGVFGFLRKSIGSIVYSTSTASLSGEKKQVARSKPTSVRNPKTISQIVQRMKVGPAQLFYAAFEKAAGSVENNPLSHSWQGVPYGPKSRTKFLQLAMTGEPKAYVPKGINFPVPGVYQVSQGSLPSLPSTLGAEDSIVIASPGSTLTQQYVERLQGLGAQVGDQLTCLALIDNLNGSYDAAFARVIIGVGNDWELTNDRGEVLQELSLSRDGIFFNDSNVACAAFLLSRGTSSATAKRSTAIMTINPRYANLMSPEAYNAAIDSYITGTLYNSLNSDWYLNQGNAQAFSGEIFTLPVPTTNDESQTCDIMLGRRLNGGQLEYVVFYYQINQGNKDPYEVANGGVTITINTTLAKVIETLGNVSYVEQGITSDQAVTYYRQMTLQGGNA